MSIASEITRINTNIENAYTACNGKGATMPVTQNSANLATCIGSIQAGGGGDWQPDTDWWNIETIITNDTENYAGKAIILYSNSDDFTEFTISSPIEAIATSDGSFYTSSTTHTWDRTKDKIVSSDANDTTPKYGTRYIILYFNSASIDYSVFTNFRNASLYTVFKCNITLPSSLSSNTFFYNNYTLQSFKFLTGYNFSSSDTSFKNFCRECRSLVKLPDNLDTSSATNLSNFCLNCFSLTKLPDNLDTSSATNLSGFCSYCFSLTKLPDNLDTSSATNLSNFCLNCYSLAELPDVLDVSHATGIQFNNLNSLVKANIKLPTPSSSYTLSLSQSTAISIQSLQYIADNAPMVSGITAKITIGSTNITRAGGSSGTIIATLTSRGWTVN